MASVTDAVAGTACGNGNLTGVPGNAQSETVAASFSRRWCTIYNIPNTNNPGNGTYSKQYFARMWYDLLIGSDSFLSIEEGQDDPYTWYVICDASVLAIPC
jgi:hypothetical protein